MPLLLLSGVWVAPGSTLLISNPSSFNVFAASALHNESDNFEAAYGPKRFLKVSGFSSFSGSKFLTSNAAFDEVLMIVLKSPL
ncbi:hypothetical protein ACFQZX_17520 [Mucilaginibacter litoreus]|uniref:Secreted protein n=1 Tax=Mucilaginibacter litoreus TaxID=1048221 RepID=A0ABW3AY10_9SPHI